MSEKATGYILLVTGLIVIIFAAFSVYSVFTARARPVNLFNFPSIKIGADSLFSGASQEQTEALKQMNNGETPQIELLPAKVLNDTSNVLAHLFLMGFMVSVGGKVAALGVTMLRPIVIKAKNETS